MTKYDLQAVGNSCIVKPFEQENKTEFGVQVISDEDKKDFGEVIAVGNGKYLTEVLGIKVGDIVAFGHFAGEDIEANGEKLKILINTENEERFDVLVIMKPTNGDTQPTT